MLRNLFCMLILIVAVLLAALGVTLPREHLPIIMRIISFFEAMIPVLAVGALVNYIWKSGISKE